jgi:hypothetical protein
LKIGVGFLFWKHRAEISIELIVSVLTDRTGVKDNQVRIDALGLDVAGRLEKARNAFRVVNVHLAAVSADFVS